jgi:3-oxoacyl-(acyl-carrier-protein) synthase
MASISAAGSTPQKIWGSYIGAKPKFTPYITDNATYAAGLLDKETLSAIEDIRNKDAIYAHLDDTVLYALHVSRQVLTKEVVDKIIGINFGSSRGATKSLEHHHTQFKDHGECSSIASPSSTLGNISSWVSHDLGVNGPVISHSITCSTALHSMLNAVAWMQSGMSEYFIVGGSESAVTPFTLAQISALRIYSKELNDFPCRALDLQKKNNTMVLGDAASALLLADGKIEDALAYITGIGYATEALKHPVSISADARCFQKSMTMCLKDKDLNEVDAIVLHAPGTIKGDKAEISAITKIFDKKMPALTSNKWCIGHTFGASGLMSVDLAIRMIQNNQFVGVPYIEYQNVPKQVKTVLVNSVGFGGNAVSILISKKNSEQ